MDSVLSVFLIFWTWDVALICFFLLIVGFVLGVVAMQRWGRKSVPPAYKPLDTAITYLEAELEKTDHAVARLWLRAGLPQQQRKAADGEIMKTLQTDSSWKDSFVRIFKGLFRREMKAEKAEEIDSLSLRLVISKRKLGSLRDNITHAVSYLSDKSNLTSPEKHRPANVADDAPAAAASDTQPESIMSDLFNSSSLPETSNPESDVTMTQPPDSSLQVEDGNLNRRTTSQLPSAKIGSEMIESYNRAVTDTSSREQFREQYQPLRIGTVNAVERRQNPNLEPEFREATDGEFFAFAIPGTTQYAVVPRFGLTIEAVSYNAGALGQVFGDPRYNPGNYHSRYCVRRPAMFKRDGDHWELQSPGELDLGPGD